MKKKKKRINSGKMDLVEVNQSGVTKSSTASSESSSEVSSSDTSRCTCSPHSTSKWEATPAAQVTTFE